MNAVSAKGASSASDSKYKKMIKGDERVIRSTTIHWGIYWKSIAVLAFGLLLLTLVRNLGIFICVVSLVMFVQAYLTKYFLLLVLTDKRVLIRHGIIQLDTIQLAHSRIESVELERTIMARILGYARVVISGTGTRSVVVPFIADAEEFRSDLDEILLERE